MRKTKKALSLIPRNCRSCGKSFTGRDYRTVFCSRVCRLGRRKRVGASVGLSNGTIGTVSELIASVDLLEKGWTVFRSLSPNGFADIVACKGAITLRLEVRTGAKLDSGRLTFPADRAPNTDGFVVIVEREVHYLPALPEVPCS
jgi:hypothetical protein